MVYVILLLYIFYFNFSYLNQSKFKTIADGHIKVSYNNMV